MYRSEVSLKTSKEAHSLAEKQLADQAKVQNSQKITQSQDLTDAKSQIKELQSQLNAANCEKEKLKSESLFLKGKADEVNIQLEKMGLKYQVSFLFSSSIENLVNVLESPELGNGFQQIQTGCCRKGYQQSFADSGT